MVGTYLKMLSMRPLDEIDDLIDAAGGRARAAAGAAGAGRRDDRAGARPGGRCRRPRGRRRPVRRGPDRRLAGGPGGRCGGGSARRAARRRSTACGCTRCSSQAGVAKSNSEVSRLLGQGAVRAGNRVLDSDGLLSASDLLRGQFLLLRKGKRDFVVGKSSTEG